MRYSNETCFKVVGGIQIKNITVYQNSMYGVSCSILENKSVEVIDSKQSLHVSFKSEFIKIG